ncbi:hypothetical protein SAMN05414139_10063 [Burkholderia sp. D7]|nr:hypothetical protein SAMN05414139_10063 [Burkholderia sp. D7]
MPRNVQFSWRRDADGANFKSAEDHWPFNRKCSCTSKGQLSIAWSTSPAITRRSRLVAIVARSRIRIYPRPEEHYSVGANNRNAASEGRDEGREVERAVSAPFENRISRAASKLKLNTDLSERRYRIGSKCKHAGDDLEQRVEFSAMSLLRPLAIESRFSWLMDRPGSLLVMTVACACAAASARIQVASLCFVPIYGVERKAKFRKLIIILISGR